MSLSLNHPHKGLVLNEVKKIFSDHKLDDPAYDFDRTLFDNTVKVVLGQVQLYLPPQITLTDNGNQITLRVPDEAFAVHATRFDEETPTVSILTEEERDAQVGLSDLKVNANQELVYVFRNGTEIKISLAILQDFSPLSEETVPELDEFFNSLTQEIKSLAQLSAHFIFSGYVTIIETYGKIK